jgi:hypothetical protein
MNDKNYFDNVFIRICMEEAELILVKLSEQIVN